MGAGASLMIWEEACPPKADEQAAIFAKLEAIFYLPVEPNRREIRQKIRLDLEPSCLDLDLAAED